LQTEASSADTPFDRDEIMEQSFLLMIAYYTLLPKVKKPEVGANIMADAHKLLQHHSSLIFHIANLLNFFS
jgi:hypothetical protein